MTTVTKSSDTANTQPNPTQHNKTSIGPNPSAASGVQRQKWGRQQEEARSLQVKVQKVIKKLKKKWFPGELGRTRVGHDANRKSHVERKEGEVVSGDKTRGGGSVE